MALLPTGNTVPFVYGVYDLCGMYGQSVECAFGTVIARRGKRRP